MAKKKKPQEIVVEKTETQEGQYMYFSQDMFYTDLSTPLYNAGKTYFVEQRMVNRWLKRGGVVVNEVAQEEIPVLPTPTIPDPILEPDSNAEYFQEPILDLE